MQVTEVNLYCEDIYELPEQAWTQTQLQSLHMPANGISRLPRDLGAEWVGNRGMQGNWPGRLGEHLLSNSN